MDSIVFTFIAYGCILLLISNSAKRYTSNKSDFFLSGRSLSGPLTALGAGASDMSSWLLMVLPGLVYFSGLNKIWMPLSLVIGAYANWKLIAKHLRVYTEVANDSLTLPSYLHNRFNHTNNYSRVLKTVSGISMLIFFSIYSASGFIGGAEVFTLAFDISHPVALFIIALVVISYTAIGGFLAVSWVDFFQGCLMFAALLIVPIVTCLHLGGWTRFYQQIINLSPTHLEMFSNFKIISILSLIGWGLGYFGQPHINSRFMAIRSIKELPVATRICMSWMIVSLVGAIATGLVGFVYFNDSPLAQQDTVFIALSKTLFNPIMAGILISAILSAVMSTVSAQILMLASIFTEDFYCGYFRKNSSKKEQMIVSRLSLILLSAIVLFIAAFSGNSLFSSISFAWSGLGAAFGPVTIMSLFWRDMSRAGAVAGIISGTASVLLWKLLTDLRVGGIFNHPDLLPGFDLIPSVIISILNIYIFSKIYRQKDLVILNEFDKVKSIIQQHNSV